MKEANIQPAYAEASAWQALTCHAHSETKAERPTPNAEVRLCRRDNGSYNKIDAVDSCIVSGL